MRRSLLAVLSLAVAVATAAACNPPKRSLLTEVDPSAPDDVAAPTRLAVYTKSGLATRVIKTGTGKINPKPDTMVRVHYTGWTSDGRKFDSSRDRGRPAEFNLRDVIPGWQEGVQLMVKGEVRRLWIPQNLAYKGARGKPTGTLVFDIHLLWLQSEQAEGDAAEGDAAEGDETEGDATEGQ